MTNKINITDEVFSQCTVYNVHIEAMSKQKPSIRDEINISNNTVECYLTEELVYIIAFIILGILILCAVGMACYYQKKNPLKKISRYMYYVCVELIHNVWLFRVRSRLYSRLYSQERYQNTIRKSEFKELMEMKMKEPIPFSSEFERLEKLSFDTIEYKTCIAELPSSRRRNRYTPPQILLG